MTNPVSRCLSASLTLAWISVGIAATPENIVPKIAVNTAPIALAQAPMNRIVIKLQPGALAAGAGLALRGEAAARGNLGLVRALDDAGLIGTERLFHAANAELAAQAYPLSCEFIV